MSVNESVKEILKNVGGANNVKDLVHCYTRLRFTLKDDTIPDDKKIEKIDGVMGVNRASGQYQVIIGNDVADYFKAIEPLLNGKESQSDNDNDGKKMNLWNRFVGMMSAAVVPVIPALIAGGLVKVILSILSLTGLVTSGTVDYRVINAIGDAPFYFLPVLVAFYAATHFKVNVPIAVGLVGILVYPDFISLLSKGSVRFFGMPVHNASYSSTIIPVLLIIWVMSYVEPFIDRFIPKMTKTFLEPLIELIIMAPLAIVVLGPIGDIISTWLATGIGFIYDKTGFIAVALLAAAYGLMVITGLHQGLSVIVLQNIATLGYDPLILVASAASNMAQGGAAMAVSLKSKDPKMKATAMGAGVSAIFGGVTEPALFGVNLRLKKPLYVAMASAGVAGIFAGLFKLKMYVMVSPAVLSLGAFIGGKGISNFIVAILTMIFATVLSFVFTLILWKEDKQESTDSKVDKKQDDEIKISGLSQTIDSPLIGEFKKIEDVPDITFAKKMLGDGIAVEPTEGKVIAPFDGEVVTVFPTKHAIGLKSSDGVELLIHLGLETVNLKGKYFTSHVKQGDHIVKGQLLLTFDIDKIKKAGYKMISPVVVTNMNELKGIETNSDLKEVNTDTAVIIANA